MTPQVWQGNGCKSSERQQKLKSAFLGQRFCLLCRCPTFCPMSPLFQARAMVLATGQEVTHVPRVIKEREGKPCTAGAATSPPEGKAERAVVSRTASEPGGGLRPAGGQSLSLPPLRLGRHSPLPASASQTFEGLPGDARRKRSLDSAI